MKLIKSLHLKKRKRKIHATISYTDSDEHENIPLIFLILHIQMKMKIYLLIEEGEIAIGETIAITESSEDPDDGTGELCYG